MNRREARETVFTIGHSTHEADDFFEVLAGHGVELLVDVRRFPGSRRVPWTNIEPLAERASRAGVAYRHLESLGGRRRPVEGSDNDGWRVTQFQGYADHLHSEEFAQGFAELQRDAEDRCSTVMCAEAQWWRCHRRLLADALVLDGWRVLHADGRGGAHEHELTEFAVVEDGRLRYPQQDE